jgi:hypothetical protein
MSSVRVAGAAAPGYDGSPVGSSAVARLVRDGSQWSWASTPVLRSQCLSKDFFIMSWLEIISVVILGGLFWLWFESTRVREIAVEHARSRCHVNEMQFLDDTVCLASIKPARDEDGRLTLKRIYTFEYSDTGNNRQPGSIIMLGQVVQHLNFGP